MEKKRIGILTGGGDAPGLNAVIRAVTVKGISSGYEVIGFEEGWRGLLEKKYHVLTLEDVEDIHLLGGTILGSSRTNVAKIENGIEIAKKHLPQAVCLKNIVDRVKCACNQVVFILNGETSHILHIERDVG